MDITQEDLMLAKDQLIADLLNQNLALRSQLNARRRDPQLDQSKQNHPSNGKPSLSVAPPSGQ